MCTLHPEDIHHTINMAFNVSLSGQTLHAGSLCREIKKLIPLHTIVATLSKAILIVVLYWQVIYYLQWNKAQSTCFPIYRVIQKSVHLLRVTVEEKSAYASYAKKNYVFSTYFPSFGRWQSLLANLFIKYSTGLNIVLSDRWIHFQASKYSWPLTKKFSKSIF